MIALAERSLALTETQVANSLHCPPDRSAIVGAVAAEHIRAMLYGACVASKDATAASTIHTTRLLTNARRATDLAWSDDTPGLRDLERDVCTSTLQAMQALGDVVDVGRGQWIAAPLRLIAIDGANDCMIAGSAPLDALNHSFDHPIACAGASRFVSIKSLTKPEHRDVVQSADDWLGPSSPLSAWTDQVVASHELRMEQAPGLSAEQLELYAPDIVRSQQRTGRWIPAGHVGRAINGVRLCRPRGAYARHYSRPHFLAHFEFNEGVLSLQKSAPIEHELTLRLRFGLDVRLGTPRTFSIIGSGQTFAIDRPSQLPEPENRIYALGWTDLTSATPSDRLFFCNAAMPFVLNALQRLSITPHISHRYIS